jgi:hypothetical protein
MLSNNSYPEHLMTAITISFGDGTGTDGNDQILDSDDGLVDAGFEVGDYLSVAGSTSNNFSGLKALVVAVGAIDVPAGTFSTEAAGDQVVLGSSVGGGSLDELLRNGVLEIYSGSQPASADVAESGTKLLRVTISSGAFVAGTATNGLNIAAATSGVSAKETAEVWSGVGLAAGTAGWFRYYANDYTTGASTSAVRFDGSCGVSSGDLQMSSLTVAVGATNTVDTGTFTFSAS